MDLLKSKKQFPSVFSDFWNKDHFYNDRFFRPSWWTMDSVKEPAMNVRDEEEGYVLELAIPGFEKEDVDIHVEDEFLIVQSKTGAEDDLGKEVYRKKEFSNTDFYKAISLPRDANKDEISANYKNGIVFITILKKCLKDTEKLKIEIK